MMRPLLLAILCASAFAQTVPVNGRVLNVLTGDPIAGATVKLMNVRQQAVLTATSDADGSYHFSAVAPDKYALSGAAPGFLSSFARVVNVSAKPEQSADYFNILLTPESTVSGVVYDDQGKPAQHVRVSVLGRHLLRGRLHYTEGQPVITSNGAFRIPHLRPGRYAIIAEPMDPQKTTEAGELVRTFYPRAHLTAGRWFFTSFSRPEFYLASITTDGQDVLTRVIDLEQNPNLYIETVVRMDPGSVTGVVQSDSDDGPGGSYAVLIPKDLDPGATNIEFVRVNDDGSFRIKFLRPGEYTAFGASDFDSNLWQNSAFLSNLLPQGTQIQVAEGQMQTVQVKLTPDDVIAQAARMAGLP